MAQKTKICEDKSQALEFRKKLLAADQNVTKEIFKDKQVGIMLSIIHAYAEVCDEKQWIDFAVNGEHPPIKLTKSQLSLLKGGGFRESLNQWGSKLSKAGNIAADDFRLLLEIPGRAVGGAGVATIFVGIDAARAVKKGEFAAPKSSDYSNYAKSVWGDFKTSFLN